MTEQKHFPLEKILTISAGDWFLINGKNPEDYEAVGIHEHQNFDSSFFDLVPENAEIVVKYIPSQYTEEPTTYSIRSGTALIPKKQE